MFEVKIQLDKEKMMRIEGECSDRSISISQFFNELLEERQEKEKKTSKKGAKI